MRFKNDAQRKAVMAKYRIFVRPEGKINYIPTTKFFNDKTKAWTFANIESVAGMGEDYIVKKVKKLSKNKEKAEYMSDLMEQGVPREKAKKITKHDFTEYAQQDGYDGITKTFGKTKKGKWILVDSFNDSTKR
jgi:hypothetical protein